MDIQKRPLVLGTTPAKPSPLIPSSSPAFATPAHPIRPAAASAAAPPKPTAILPIFLPPGTLRPLAFRTFTKRHNLTLTSSALQALASFVGKHCGSGWRDEGLAEKVLEEVCRRWRKAGGQLIVEGDSKELQNMLVDLAGCMVGGKISTAAAGGLSRQSSFGLSGMKLGGDGSPGAGTPDRDVGMDSQQEMEDEELPQDPRHWLKVISALDQPRLTYNPMKRHFEKVTRPATMFPDPSTRTAFYKQRYHMVHQRLMRNESFQAPSNVPIRTASLQRSASSFNPQQSYKLSNITDLLGRHGSSHILLGLLTVAPAGHYAISDLSGSIMLDLSLASAVPDGAWFVPGMMVIVDGTYEEEGVNGTTMVGSNTGVGGTIGGKFIASTIAGPPAERREQTLGIADAKDHDEFTAASGFGWVDFLGVGSEKSVGAKMRRIERKILKKEEAGRRGRIVILGELNLDVPETLEALRKILGRYESDEPGTTPMVFVLTGNFVSTAGMARTGSAGSIEYKEHFDLLAATLSDFPRVLQSATFLFIPGDNDPWASAFTASASTTLPRTSLPAALTSRIRKAFTAANSDREKAPGSTIHGEAVFAANPARLSLFGPAQEMVVLRDDMTGRIRRNAVTFTPAPEAEGEDMNMEVDDEVAAAEAHEPERVPVGNPKKPSAEDANTARRLVKMVADQAYLAPFSALVRPVLWDYAPALHMVPLPTALVLVDPEAPPFALGYEGCFVMNPGRLLVENRKGQARWAEFDTALKRGKTMQIHF